MAQYGKNVSSIAAKAGSGLIEKGDTLFVMLEQNEDNKVVPDRSDFAVRVTGTGNFMLACSVKTETGTALLRVGSIKSDAKEAQAQQPGDGEPLYAGEVFAARDYAEAGIVAGQSGGIRLLRAGKVAPSGLAAICKSQFA